MKRIKTIIAYSDGGHGWAKVKRAELEKLRIADLISPYSYERGEWAYLEEDCDLNTYCQALHRAGIPFKFREYVALEKRSRIRGYANYSPFNK